MSKRPRRPCVSCGKTTYAEGYLCMHCRPSKAKRPDGLPCLACGDPTWSKDQTHPRCRTPKEVIRMCPCGVHKITGKGLVCKVCSKARNDDESPWDLEDAGGYWRPVGGIQEWVPLLVEASNIQVDDRSRECSYGGCGVWYVQRKKSQLYCSERCQKTAYVSRRRAREQVAA